MAKCTIRAGGVVSAGLVLVASTSALAQFPTPAQLEGLDLAYFTAGRCGQVPNTCPLNSPPNTFCLISDYDGCGDLPSDTGVPFACYRAGSGEGIQGGLGGKDVTDPVNLGDGSFVYELPLISASCLNGPGLSFKLTYRSKNGYDDRTFGYQNPNSELPLPRFSAGRNWDHSYNIFIARNITPPSSQVLGTAIHTGDGQVMLQPRQPSGGPVEVGCYRLETNPDVLVCDSPAVPDFTFVKAPDSPVRYRFPTEGDFRGQLDLIEGSYGANVSVRYYGEVPTDPAVLNGLVKSVSDTCGRSLQFTYQPVTDGIATVQMLSTVSEVYVGASEPSQPGTTSTLRQVLFTYCEDGDPDGNVGDLKSVTLRAPAGEGPDRVWRFTYYVGVEPHETNIKQVIEPGERFVLENTYELGYARPVLHQDLGDRLWVRRYDSVIGQVMPAAPAGQEPTVAREYDYVYYYTPATVSAPEKAPTLVVNRSGYAKVLTFGVKAQTQWLLARSDYAEPVADRATLITQARALTGSPPSIPGPATTTGYTHGTPGSADAGRLTKAVLPTVVTGQVDEITKSYNTKAKLVETRYKSGNGDPDIIEKWQHGSTGCSSCSPARDATAYGRALGTGPTTWQWEKTYDGSQVTSIRRGNMDGDNTTPAPGLRESGELSREEFVYSTHGQLVEHRTVLHYGNLLIPGDIDRVRVDQYEHYDVARLNGTFAEDNVGRRGRVRAVVKNATSTSPLERERVEYDYDKYGNIISITRTTAPVTGTPQVISKTLYTRNAYGWVLAQEERGSNNELMSRTSFTYDVRGNAIREDQGRWASAATAGSGDPVTTIRQYDHYDRLIRVSREVGDVSLAATQVSPLAPVDLRSLLDTNGAFAFSTTEYGYDPDDKLVLVRKGDAASVPARQPGNIVQREFDHRGMLVAETRGVGPSASTMRYEYDARGRAVRRFVASGTTTLRDQQTTYDVLDRVVTTRVQTGPVSGTPAFTETHATYDAYWALRDQFVVGRATPAGTMVTLSYSRRENDFLGRPTRTIRYSFAPVANWQPPATPGLHDSTTYVQYTPTGQAEFRDLPAASSPVLRVEYSYDGLDRTTRVLDPEGNFVEYIYDEASNLVSVRETEYQGDGASVATGAAQRFDMSYAYDALARMISTTNGSGETTTYAYDSRGNVDRTVNPLGKATWYAYDGQSRLVGTSVDMGSAGSIDTGQVWDLSGRLAAQIDDNGNRTSYWYDEQDRPTLTRMADGTIHGIGKPLNPGEYPTWDGNWTPSFPAGWTHGYDAAGNAVFAVDANGSVITSTFDARGLVLAREIVPGSGQGVLSSYPVVGPGFGRTGTENETYEYDGLGRLLRAVDDDTEVLRVYDSMSRLTGETSRVAGWVSPSQRAATSASNARTVGYTYNAGSELTSITYPDGRVISLEYDRLKRPWRIKEGAITHAAYTFYGTSRVVARAHPNNTRTSYSWSGYTENGTLVPGGFRRIVGVTNHIGSDPAILPNRIDRRELEWDAAGNKIRVFGTFPANAGGPNPTRQFGYDSANRLVTSTFPNDSFSVTTYNLDGVHNRLEVTVDPVNPGGLDAGAQIGQYTMADGQSFSQDQPVNQYTTVPLDQAFYDENGNLAQLGVQAGGGLLLALGVQGASPELSAGVNQAIAEGGVWGDLTNDDALTVEDAGIALAMVNEPGLLGKGGDCEDPFGTECGPLRLSFLRYDYRNQMVEYEDAVAGVTHRYAYDALGRRVLKSVSALIEPPLITQYVHGGQASWQVLAEYASLTQPSASATATYVYGLYIDEPITMRRDYDGPGGTSPQDLYYHQDDLFSTVAMTAGPSGATIPNVGTFAIGQVVERYRYGDYGLPWFYDNASNGPQALAVGSSRVGNPYLFTCREWDGETRLYQYRTRYMEPTWGRFTTRDTIGTWGDGLNFGNATTMVGSRPTVLRDPFGLLSESGEELLRAMEAICDARAACDSAPECDIATCKAEARDIVQRYEDGVDKLKKHGVPAQVDKHRSNKDYFRCGQVANNTLNSILGNYTSADGTNRVGHRCWQYAEAIHNGFIATHAFVLVGHKCSGRSPDFIFDAWHGDPRFWRGEQTSKNRDRLSPDWHPVVPGSHQDGFDQRDKRYRPYTVQPEAIPEERRPFDDGVTPIPPRADPRT